MDQERLALLKKIGEARFTCVELNLYLDTHPGDMKAKEFYETCLKKKKDLMSENECGCACISHYEWEQKPLVWEGGHC